MKRIRFGNEHMELSFDSLTGELLEFINIENGDNLLKNWTSLRTMPFNIIVDKTESITCHPIKYKLIKNNTDLSAAFENFAEKDGKVLKITYPGIASESEIFNIKVIVTIKLMNESGKNNQKRSFWNISVENNQEYPITKVLFPFICGVYIGSKYENDTLIFPLISGIKQQNPIKEMSQPAKILGWKWQEYKYSYPLDCFPSGRGNDGSYLHSALYGGNASMMWLDYYDESLGFYMASYDENFGLTYINAETFGETRPGMNFFFTMQTPLNKGEQSISHIFEIALHSGDWHSGADLYRDWRQSITKKEDMISPPSWFSKNSGMVAHYDFKYQSGEVVHKYKDIPTLIAQAKEMGLEHIMLSGWHKNGFDNGFPLYYCDEDLGDEAEFQKNVSEGVENGVHISFYVNSQLFNTKYKDIYPDLFDSSHCKKAKRRTCFKPFWR